MYRRPVTMALALLLFGTAALVGPVNAVDRGEIVVGHGETVTGQYPPILVPMPLADISYHPSNCTDPSPYCDRFGLKVNLSAQPENARLYVTLEWKGEQLSDANYCMLYLWDDPEVLYSPIKDEACVENTAVLDFLPLKSNYQLVVRNFTATASEGYTLTVSYRDYGGSPGDLN